MFFCCHVSQLLNYKCPAETNTVKEEKGAGLLTLPFPRDQYQEDIFFHLLPCVVFQRYDLTVIKGEILAVFSQLFTR